MVLTDDADAGIANHIGIGCTYALTLLVVVHLVIAALAFRLFKLILCVKIEELSRRIGGGFSEHISKAAG